MNHKRRKLHERTKPVPADALVHLCGRPKGECVSAGRLSNANRRLLEAVHLLEDAHILVGFSHFESAHRIYQDIRVFLDTYQQQPKKEAK